MFNKKSIVRVISIVIVVLLMSSTASARPLQSALGTGFTYQGKLTDGGVPANRAYDLEFKLYDDLNGGGQVGSAIILDDVTVTNGLFTVQLDFGDVFDGTALYLEIGVRPGSDTGAYTPLTPRQPLSATPYAIYAAKAPWSGITNMPAGFADGMDNGSAYQNVKVVAKSGGDFTSIQAALDSITDASDVNRYLVKVMPGVYTGQVTMKEYVDIEGSGELTTKITFTGNASINTGTLVGANNAELRFLTVENTGGNTHAVAIYNYYSLLTMTHITASASGGTSHNIGVYNNNSSSTMTNLVASASGGTYTWGVDNSYSASPTMTNVTASASGATDQNFGVENFYSSPTMTNVTANGLGGTGENYGVDNNHSSAMMTNVIASASKGMNSYGVDNENSSPTMTNVTASASGGANYNNGVQNDYSSSPTINNSVISASGGLHNYGIFNNAVGGNGTVRVNNSQISGGTNAIRNDTGYITLVGASQLDGGVDTFPGGTVTCAGVYDANYTFYASTCP